MLLKNIKDASEEHITRLATKLLSNESFVLALQAMVSRTLRTRDQLESALRVVLATLAVPTSEDIDGLADRVADLEAQIESISRRIETQEIAGSKPARKKGEGSSRKSNQRAAQS